MSKQSVLLLLLFGCFGIVVFLSSLQHDNFKNHRLAKAFALSLISPLFLVAVTALHVVLYVASIVWLPIMLIGAVFGKDLTWRIGPSASRLEEFQEKGKTEFAKFAESIKSRREDAPGILKRSTSAAAFIEARRLARNRVKDEMRNRGIKHSLVESSEITKLANELMEVDPSILIQAEENIRKADIRTKGTHVRFRG